MRSKQLYNYLVNTLGISKQLILEHVEIRIKDIIERHVTSKLDSHFVQDLIANKITQLLTNGFPSSSLWADRQSFENFVKSCVREEVTKILKDTKEIKVEMIAKKE